MTFYQMIDPVSFLTVFVIDHRVIEIINMARSFPRGRMHENGSINTHNILIHAGHTIPPIVLYIFFEFTSPLPVIIYRLEAIVDFTTGKYKTIFFSVRD